MSSYGNKDFSAGNTLFPTSKLLGLRPLAQCHHVANPSKKAYSLHRGRFPKDFGLIPSNSGIPNTLFLFPEIAYSEYPLFIPRIGLFQAGQMLNPSMLLF
jgi:hypothetical protein